MPRPKLDHFSGSLLATFLGCMAAYAVVHEPTRSAVAVAAVSAVFLTSIAAPVAFWVSRLAGTEDQVSKRFLVFAPILSLLALETWFPASMKPLYVAAIATVYFSLASTASFRAALRRAAMGAAIVAIAGAPFVLRWGKLFLLQGGEDEIIYSLGGL